MLAAEPSGADKDAAKAAYGNGLELEEKGQHDAALAKYREAYRLVPTPITGLAVGRELEQLGQFVEARRVYAEVLALPPKPTESADAKAARAEASTRAKAVEGKVGRLLIVVKGDAAEEVTLDGKGIHVPKSGVEITVNPGKHVIVASSGANRAEVTKDVVAGKTVFVELSLVSGSQTPPSTPPAGPAESVTKTNGLVWAGLAVSGVGLVTGIVATINHGALDDKCVRLGELCSDTRAARDRAQVVGYVGWSLVVVGGGVLIWGLTHPVVVESATVSVRLDVGPGRLGLLGVF